MAFRTKKISQMDPKGSNLASTDLLEISELVSGSYVTKSITGAQIAASAPAAAWGTITGTLSSQTDLNTALSGKVPTTRTLTINGTTQDLSADRTFTISTGITIGTTAITSGTVGRVLFEGTGNVVQESANLFWDNTNGRLGIGTSSPAYKLDVVGDARISDNVFLTNGIIANITGTTRLQGSTNYFTHNRLGSSGALGFQISQTNVLSSFWRWSDATDAVEFGNARNAPIALFTNNTEKMRIVGGGNVLINTTTDAGYKLDVNGTARVQTSLTLSGTNPVAQIAGSTSYSSYIGGQINGSISGQAITSLYVAYPNYTGTGGSIIGYALMASNSYFDTLNVGVTATTYVGSNVIFNASTPTLRLMGYNALTGGSGAGSGTLLLTDRTAGSMLGMSATYGGGGSRLTIFNQYSDGATSRIKINMAGTDTACFFADGSLQIGNGETTIASAILSASSTTRGFLPPRMTTTQKNAIASPATGLMVYDTTLNLISVYNGTTWITL